MPPETEPRRGLCGAQVDFVVAAYSAAMQGTAMKVAGLIRAGGATVDVLLEPKKKVALSFEYALSLTQLPL